MMVSRIALSAAVALIFVASANAQMPERKPGLWEMQMSTSGMNMPDMSEHFAKMPPEQRAQMEEMMKQRGITFGAHSMTMHTCLTPQEVKQEKESADAFLNKGKGKDNCKSTTVARSATEVRFTAVCKDEDGETRQVEGRIYDLSPEHFNMDMTSRGSKSGETKMQQKARWVSASCGNVK